MLSPNPDSTLQSLGSSTKRALRRGFEDSGARQDPDSFIGSPAQPRLLDYLVEDRPCSEATIGETYLKILEASSPVTRDERLEEQGQDLPSVTATQMWGPSGIAQCDWEAARGAAGCACDSQMYGSAACDVQSITSLVGGVSPAQMVLGDDGASKRHATEIDSRDGGEALRGDARDARDAQATTSLLGELTPTQMFLGDDAASTHKSSEIEPEDEEPADIDKPMVAFHDQDMDALRHTLRQIWGHAQLSPEQELIVSSVVGGRDVLGLLPTGAGKSMCYSLPSVHAVGTTIVLSPTLSLMSDQAMKLEQRGICVARLGSDLKREVENDALSAVRDGRVRVLFLSPERLVASGKGFSDKVRILIDELHGQGRLQLFVVDEAHCISDWGFAFRPSYRRVSMVRELWPRVSILALTATATPHVVEDILQSLRLRSPVVVRGALFRQNLHVIVRPQVTANKRLEQIRDLTHDLERQTPGSVGIVYANSRKRVSQLALRLANGGCLVEAYHAGLPVAKKNAVLKSWLAGDTRVVVCTVAFGMGIDNPRVRWVAHYEPPTSLARLVQEIGRAGRDGMPAQCVLWPGSWALDPARSERELQALEEVKEFLNGSGCRHQTLLKHFGEERVRVPCGSCDICGSDAYGKVAVTLASGGAMARVAKRQRCQRDDAGGFPSGTGCSTKKPRGGKHPCPVCGYAMRVVSYGVRSPFRGCSKHKETKCKGRGKLSPAGWQALRSSTRSARPARAFFGMYDCRKG